MEVIFTRPIEFCRGKLSVLSEFYCRKNRFGKTFVQRCPRSQTEKQIAWRKEFAKRYAGKKTKK